MTDKIFEALQFATHAHSGQFRKSTRIPYIVHPISVMEHLIRHGASNDAIVAGILHDTLEDTPTTIPELRMSFGDRITELVMGATEPDKSLSWETRKQHTIASLATTNDIEQLMVVCADKLSNINSIAADLAQHGPNIWMRFNRGYDMQKWYYCGLAEIFAKHVHKSAIFAEYIAITARVFDEQKNNNQ